MYTRCPTSCVDRGKLVGKDKGQSKSASPSTEDQEELRALMDKNREAAPVDFAKYARRAGEIITQAVEKARERQERKRTRNSN